MPDDDGVWVVYDIDHGPYVIALAADEGQAIAVLARAGYGKIAWIPYGDDFGDSIKAWEESARA